MKFPSNTYLAVIALAAGRSGGNAFVPAPTSSKVRVAPTSLNAGLFDGINPLTILEEINQIEEFDPEEDEEKAGQLLDLVTVALESLDAAESNEEELLALPQKDVSRRSVTKERTSDEYDEVNVEEGKAGETQSSYASALKLIQGVKTTSTKGGSMEFATYSERHPEFPDVDLSGAMKKLKGGAPPLNQIFGPKKILRLIQRVVQSELAFNQFGVVDAVEKAGSKEAAYEACFTTSRIKRFNYLPKPTHVIENWEKDTEFARQFFCGLNPVMIEVTTDPEKQLSANMVEHFGKDKLKQLADKKQLLFVSYDDLADINQNGVNPHQAYPIQIPNEKNGPDGGPAPQDQERYCYGPIITFVYDYANDELDVLGIQLERTKDARVYTKNTTRENEWLFVKSCVATADSNMHQWVSHLGNTHLTIEPHIIAIYNTLRKAKHPLYTFLKPICKDTLLLNYGARTSLASYKEGDFGDYQSSVGTGQFMQLIGKMWSRYSFFEKSGLPNELASRGWTDDVKMPAYLYREDGMKLWDAIGNFAEDFVDEIYGSDEDVASDEAVQDWATETTDPERGAVPGFPTSFKDKETLVKVLQTLMWITSGLHAAVNSPQYDFYAYAPNKPLNMRADLSTLPEDDADIREWMFENMFPHVSSDSDKDWLKSSTSSNQHATLDAIKMGHLLTLPSDHCLDNLSDEFATVGKKSYQKFLIDLDFIGDEIEERNKKSKKAKKGVYYYLNPSVVATSIDI